MIAFKTTSAVDQWHDLHSKMREVVLDILANVWPPNAAFIITRIADYDPNQQTEIHTCGPPHRAVDVRTANVLLDDATCTAVEQNINQRWKYGDGVHPVALYHTGSAPHLHLQVRDETSFFPVKEV